jgi:hypothetical protein
MNEFKQENSTIKSTNICWFLNFYVLGKTMENVRNRIEIKTAFDSKYLQKYVSKRSKVLVENKMV